MAVLTAPPSRGAITITETCPKGTHLAVCIHVEDQFGVERKKYQSEETEKQDLERFYFGVIGKDRKAYVVGTRRMKISGHEKAGLVKFLAAWNGEAFPYGTDTVKWAVGRGAQITVAHKESTKTPGLQLANITAISPVMEELVAKVPALDAFKAFLKGDDTNTPSDTSASTTAQPAADEDVPF